MSCKCLQEIREAWMKENQDITGVIYDCYPVTNLSDPKSPKKTAQRVEINYWYTKKDGSKIKKTQKSFVTHIFCPFCGKSYDPIEVAPQEKKQS